MANPVLDRLVAQRDQQMANMDSILDQVDDRDLVDAEKSLLTATQQRITELDAQIAPLADLESLRSAHTDAVAALPRPTAAAGTVPAQPRRADGMERPQYRTAGEVVVDIIRARGIHGQPDADAARRLTQTRAVSDQTTTNTPGLLPAPIVGAVVDLIDANRPLISSLGGAKGLGSIPGATFTRPKITQHVTVGVQTAQKTQLPSQNMAVSAVTFNKATYGGTVDISRQDIDWTSPGAWDILIRDLANVYAIQTETAVAADFATKATGTKPPALPAAPNLANWTTALYTAAMHSYQAGQRMPDRLWVSLDVWAALGSLVDVSRVIFPVDTAREMGAPGTSNLADFRGDVLGLPRVVVPTLPAKSAIIGNSALYEAYEEVIGLLSVVEPSILGVQVAYGGYVAFGSLAQPAFVALDLSAVTNLPTSVEFDVSAPETPDPAPKAK